MTEIEKIMNSSYYTISIITRSGKRITRSAFAFDADEASRWVGPGETVVGIFSQSKTSSWTVSRGFQNA